MTKSILLVALVSLFALGPYSSAQAQSQPQSDSAIEDLSTIFNYVKISDRLSSSGQIPYEQMASLKEAGFDLVINLATVNPAGNALEGFLVAEQNIAYLNIPVSWREPAMDDLQMFFDVMESSSERKVYVHCAANMRASVFVYLFRTLVQGEDEAVARIDMEKVWDPAGSPQWSALIESAQAQYASSN